MVTRLVASLVVVLMVTTAGDARADTPTLDPPVPGRVLAGFHLPDPYGPGHRGVDLATAPDTPVRASAAGYVTFAGRVVDATWVTVDHGTLRTTVGPLASVAVRRGQWVARGAVVGTSAPAHGRAAVHWSARRGDTYLDPLGYVDTLGVDRATATLVAGASGDGDHRRWPRGRVR